MTVLTPKPNTTPIALVKRGVANEKVVAVAQTTAKIAVTSITLPKIHQPYHQATDGKLQKNAADHVCAHAS